MKLGRGWESLCDIQVCIMYTAALSPYLDREEPCLGSNRLNVPTLTRQLGLEIWSLCKLICCHEHCYTYCTVVLLKYLD